ncbi:MAG: DNA-processing protein DprA [Clostridia bacterium]|nr:DNA-processing protein DprA [Clostridia bacterium]
MADMESICARLCLLTRAAWREDLPSPLTRPNARKMIRLGALSGLTLRRVPDVKEEYYVRAQALLSRSAEIYEAVERCKAQGYDVILPEDDDWPVNLCALGQHMPQFLFVRGNRSLLSRRAVAVAGSREIGENTLSIARRIGKEIALKGYTLVCGGAEGVDTAVQSACLEAGGTLILVPAHPCHDLLRQKYLRCALENGKLLIACEAWPQERFTGSKALMRNHSIYALGDAAIAVAARNGVGGTWNGASHCLRREYTPVFTIDEPDADFDGCRALISLGAKALDVSGNIGDQLFAEGM